MPETVDNYTYAASEAERFAAEIAAAAAILAERITADPAKPVCHEFCPGNGSRYALVLTPNSVEEGPAVISGVGTEMGYLLSLPSYGTAYPINLTGGYCSLDYAAEKWTRGNLTDGAFIGAVLTALREMLAETTEPNPTDPDA